MTTTAHQHLQTIINNWHHLRDMLDTHTAAPWPPSGRITDYLRALEYGDAQALPTMRGGRTELEAGAGAAPLNLDALDAIRTTELALIGTADHIATVAQRSAVTVGTRQGWTDEVHRQAALLAARDQADPRRWSLTHTPTRTPVHAAVWLQQRLDNVPGPFRPLTTDQQHLIEDVAREASERVQLALVILRRRTSVPYPCPHCRARSVVVLGADGNAPVVLCEKCGRTWTGQDAAAVA